MIQVVPAIDIINGQTVRLQKGDYSKKTNYKISPLSMAKQYEENGFKYLHVVDLDAARTGKQDNIEILKKIAKETSLKLDVGGGIKSLSSIENLLKSGIDRVNIGSMAVKDPDFFKEALKKFGSEHIILSADVEGAQIKINAWQTESRLNIYQLIEMFVSYGLKYITATSISQDGMLSGPDFNLYKNLKKGYPDLYITASGGVTSIGDFYKLNDLKIDAAIIGKAIYENKISFNNLKVLIS